MPTPRSLAIVTCSCGWRLGNFQRASAHEDMEAAEAVLINNEVPRMVRHWTLGHELSVNERAPIWVKAVVAKAARELAASDAPASGETGLVRR